jgi:hypothetical protein
LCIARPAHDARASRLLGRHDGDAEYGFVIITLKSVILAESARAINNLLGYDKYYTSAPGVPYCYDLRENH